MTNKQLAETLHAYGSGEWIRRGDHNEMLRVAQACVDALDEIQKLEGVIVSRERALGFTPLPDLDFTSETGLPPPVEPSENERLRGWLRTLGWEYNAEHDSLVKIPGDAHEPPATHYHENCPSCTCRDPDGPTRAHPSTDPATAYRTTCNHPPEARGLTGCLLCGAVL